MRQQQKQEMSKRRSAASHKRMKIISQLAEEVATTGERVGGAGMLSELVLILVGRKKKEKEDTFGQNDEDWHIYREIVSLNVLNYSVYLMRRAIQECMKV